MWWLGRLACEGFCRMRAGICVRAEARAISEDVDKASCCAPVWLGWRAKQELRSGEPFDDAHGSATDGAVPERAGLIGGRGCR